MASCTVRIFSASSSGISISKASSKAITSSTVSRESAPKSSTNEAFDVTSPSSTPNCSTMICFTLSSTAAISSPRLRSIGTGTYAYSCQRSRIGVGLDQYQASTSRTGFLFTYLRMLVDVGDSILDGAELFRILVRNFHPEVFLQCHDQFYLVQGICA